MFKDTAENDDTKNKIKHAIQINCHPDKPDTTVQDCVSTCLIIKQLIILTRDFTAVYFWWDTGNQVKQDLYVTKLFSYLKP